jgi:hypothetical protein
VNPEIPESRRKMPCHVMTAGPVEPSLMVGIEFAAATCVVVKGGGGAAETTTSGIVKDP